MHWHRSARGALAFSLLAGAAALDVQETASASTPTWAAYVGDASGSGLVEQFNLTPGSGSVGTVISGTTGYEEGDITFAPDGSTAYVAGGGTSVTPITVGSSSAGTQFTSGFSGTQSIAITPDGKTAYVTNQVASDVVPITLATRVVGTAISTGLSSFPTGIAITPDGKTAYVADSGSSDVSVINLTTLARTTIPMGTNPQQLAVTPDGKFVYVTVGGANQVAVISTATNTLTTTVPTGASSGPKGLAITPDGSTVYVADDNSGAVTVISTATNTVTATLPTGGTFPDSVAITPDGATAYVTNSSSSSHSITPITISSNTVGTAITTGGSTSPQEIAIAPDQAPTAAFSGSLSGSVLSLDGSASTSPLGSIVSYAWNFGDGSTATTSGPTTSHTYSATGSFTVTLTVTNSAGTSTAQVFTGRSMLRNGSSIAQTTHSFTIAAAATSTTTTASTPGQLEPSQKTGTYSPSGVTLALACVSGSGCSGTASLSVARDKVKAGHKVVTHLVLATATVSNATAGVASVHFALTRVGKQVFASRRPLYGRFRMTLLVLSGGRIRHVQAAFVPGSRKKSK